MYAAWLESDELSLSLFKSSTSKKEGTFRVDSLQPKYLFWACRLSHKLSGNFCGDCLQNQVSIFPLEDQLICFMVRLNFNSN